MPFLGFSRTVVALGLVSFFTDFSSEMIYPILPLFLTEQLGVSGGFLGLIEGVAESTASLLKLGSGYVSDRLRRRKALVLAGYGLSSIARPLVAVAMAGWHVLVIRFADRVGKGVRTSPRDALLAEQSAPEMRARVYGFHRGMDHAGAVVGPLAAVAFLFWFPGEYRSLFALAAIPGVLAMLSIVFLVQEKRAAAEGKDKAPAEGRHPSTCPLPQGERDREASPANCVARPSRELYMYLIPLFVFTLANSSDMFLLLRAKDLGVGERAIPLLWSALHVVKMVFALLGGMLADRIGCRRTLVFGWVLYGGVYAMFSLAASPAHVWALFLVYGLFYGLTEGPERALVSHLSPPEARGTTFGIYNFVGGVGALPASLLMGLIWQTWGPEAALVWSAALALLAAVTLIFALPRRR